MNIRDIIKEQIDSINYSDMGNQWGEKPSNLKVKSIAEAASKLKELYRNYTTSIETFNKKFIKNIQKETGLTIEESRDLVLQFFSDFTDNKDEFDLEITIMGMGTSVFDLFDSLKNQFGSFSNFKERLNEIINEWQTKMGHDENENGFICDQIEYDEDSHDTLQMFLSGMTPDEAFHKILDKCNLNGYIN